MIDADETAEARAVRASLSTERSARHRLKEKRRAILAAILALRRPTRTEAAA